MELVKQLLNQNGFDHVGFSELKTPLTMSFYQSWIDKNYHADMNYLKEHLELKATPQKLLARARSAVVVTHPYGGGQKNDFPLTASRVAAYAKDTDYHLWLKDKLQNVCDQLKAIYPEEEFLCFTDSSPVMERDLAHRAGLGWFGKNTCLIDKKKGSLFLIAEIYTTLDLKGPEELPADHCGTCTRCIEACPTQALEVDKTLNAERCISYWTIESRKIPPIELREKFSGWLFGCDICQTVCPWNIKAYSLKSESPDLETMTHELRWILESSNKELQKKFSNTPLSRTGGRGLKRNALIVIANHQLHELYASVLKYKDDSRLGELAQWTLQKLAK